MPRFQVFLLLKHACMTQHEMFFICSLLPTHSARRRLALCALSRRLWLPTVNKETLRFKASGLDSNPFLFIYLLRTRSWDTCSLCPYYEAWEELIGHSCSNTASGACTVPLTKCNPYPNPTNVRLHSCRTARYSPPSPSSPILPHIYITNSLPRPPPVQTNLSVLSPTQYVLLLPTSPAQPLNHLVVFLLPEASLPQDTAASVYIQLSPDQPFLLLGAIGNEKPSAIFRVKGLSAVASVGTGGGEVDVDDMTDESGGGVGVGNTSAGGAGSGSETTVTLGISIEPLSSVLASLSSLPSTIQSAQTPRTATPAPPAGQLILANKSPTTLILARRIIKNAFNYLSSFAVRTDIPGQGITDVVPLKAFQDWWGKFEKKVEFDPGVLERED